MNLLKALFCSFLLVGFVNAAVDINTADKAALGTLKGIGPAKAEEIIKYRQEKGPFKSVDELKNVKGIGDKILEAIKADVTVGNNAPAAPTVKAEEKKPAEKAPEKPSDKPSETKKPASPAAPTPNKM